MTNKREIDRQKPPKWVDQLLEWYLSDQYLEEVQGDLHEWFFRRARRSGFRKARLFYLFDVIMYFRLFRVKKLNDMENNNNLLLINYVKMTFRQFRRNLGYATMNTLGLTIGLLSVMYISIFILHELSYDKFHKDFDSIYRIIRSYPETGMLSDSNPSPWKSRMAEEFPEILEHTRLGQDIVLIEQEEASFLENGFFWADGNFMEFFSFEVLAGDRASMLHAPNSIVLTESKAMRYFGTTDIIGEVLPVKVYDGNKDFLMEVTGVIADVPSNSHLQFDFLGSMYTTDAMYGHFEQYWGLNWLQAYVKLAENTDLEKLQARVPDFFEKRYREGSSRNNHFIFQPLSEVRLHSDNVGGNIAKGNMDYVILFGCVAFLILLAASINYVNLTTATSTRRGKEVGIRKVFGAVRSQVARQFYVECGLVLLMAFGLALVLAVALMPAFEQVVEKQLVYTDVFQGPVLLVMAIAFVVILAFSGFYPALVMNRFTPVDVLRGDLLRGLGKRSGTRRVQVLVQFVIATFLISSTAIVVNQMQYFSTYDMGFENNQLINIPVDDRSLQGELTLIKNRMANIPGVNAITATGEALPSAMNNRDLFDWPDRPEDLLQGINIVAVDFDYLNTIQANLIDGRNLSVDMPTDSTFSCLLNESAFALTQQESIQDLRVGIGEMQRNVVGLVENFHYNSLHSEVEPCVYLLLPPGTRSSPDNLIVRINSASMNSVLDELDGIWREFSDQPFDFAFVDQAFARLYGDEQKFMTVVLSFAAIGIFLAILGLVSLVAFVAERRSKELSIRKVLGASRLQVLGSITGQFGLIFLLSVLIALPLSLLAMQEWLNGFAYRDELSWPIFAVAAAVALVITLFSIGVQAMRVASSNPTRYLSDNK